MPFEAVKSTANTHAAVKVRYIKSYHHVKTEFRLPRVTVLMHANAKTCGTCLNSPPCVLPASRGWAMLATGPAPWATMVRRMATMLKWGVVRWPRGQPIKGFC